MRSKARFRIKELALTLVSIFPKLKFTMLFLTARNSLLREGDATIFSVKGNDHEKNFNASYSLPVFVPKTYFPSFLFSHSNYALGQFTKNFPAVLSFSADLER